MDDHTLSAGQFKATCLKLMDEVAASGREVVITKRGKPVAKLVAASQPDPLRAGSLAHTVQILGDIEMPLYFISDPVSKFKEINLTSRGRRPPPRKAAKSAARKPAKQR